MKYLAVCKLNNKVYLQENDKGELDLFRKEHHTDLDILAGYMLCVIGNPAEVGLQVGVVGKQDLLS